MSFKRDLPTLRALLITKPEVYYNLTLMRKFFHANVIRLMRLPSWKTVHEERANMELMIKTVFQDNYEEFLSTVVFPPLSDAIGLMERKSLTTAQCLHVLTQLCAK